MITIVNSNDIQESNSSPKSVFTSSTLSSIWLLFNAKRAAEWLLEPTWVLHYGLPLVSSIQPVMLSKYTSKSPQSKS